MVTVMVAMFEVESTRNLCTGLPYIIPTILVTVTEYTLTDNFKLLAAMFDCTKYEMFVENLPYFIPTK